MLDAVSAHASQALHQWAVTGHTHSGDRIETLLDGYGLRVKGVGASSALLFGADACIDPSTRTIRIRRDLHPLIRREVLAHELAHAVLGHDNHGSTSQQQTYVSAYGKNERIERMADNLAALLLVSDSELEVATKNSATFTAAAEFLNVSIDTLIRRLTQHRSPVTLPPSNKYVLLPHQIDAAQRPGNICLDGGTGTGKTEVLFERLLRLAEDTSAGSARILFVTYLRRHMVYLFERMALRAPLLAERVNFTTFHDYAADIVLRNAARTGCTGTPTVVGQGELIFLLEKIFPDTSRDELLAKCNDFRQNLRHDIQHGETWEALLTEQLYQLNYIHNGSLGNLADKLMALDGIVDDESDRWDAIFIDNVEQLTYPELTVLRLAARRAKYGIAASSGYSPLPYAFRGTSDAAVNQWKQDCGLAVIDFSSAERLRPNATVTEVQVENPLQGAVLAVKDILDECQPDERIIVAVRHNAELGPCRTAISDALPDQFLTDTGPNPVCLQLYASLDGGLTFDVFLEEWWDRYRNASDADRVKLQSVLADSQMFTEHCRRSEAVGLPAVSMSVYMDSIRPHHQYRDIQLAERISIQTLHSLSGGEAEHVIVVMDGLYASASDRTLSPANKALFENACARASKSLWVVHTNCGV
jgi:hypothetical protein